MISITEEEIMSTWKSRSETPLVTIRCLAYNHERYISDALDGLLMQKTDFPFEILIHDDASTDRTADIIREYEKKYPHIMRPIYEIENQYSKRDGSLRRIMNQNVKGKYIAYCEGDDYWTSPYKLQRQIRYMENNPDCSMTFHAVNYVKDGSVIKNDRRSAKECDFTTDDLIRGGGFFCATLSLCLRAKDSFCTPKYRKISLVGDYPMQVMMSTKGRVHYFPQVMGCYRVSSIGSWSERMQSLDSQIKHNKNGIEWLQEFDKETKGVFTNSVKYVVLKYRIGLLNKDKNESFFTLLKDIIKFKNKNLILILFKTQIAYCFPFVVNIYHYVRGRLNGK